jgi:hypothetical protein
VVLEGTRSGRSRSMAHVVVMVLVPLVPLTCLALVLWLDRLEETLDRSVDRRREHAAAPQAQLEASLAGVSSSSGSSSAAPTSPRAAVATPEVSLGGSTNR